MVKERIFLLLAFAMIISLFPTTVFATEFSDMPNDWSTVALENAVANGLLNGDNGKIRPDDNLTRAEMATIVNRAFGAEEKDLISKYTDVSENAWYYDEMAKAIQMGTFVGDGNRLNPDNSITREEAFVVLARAFKLNSASESELNIFTDKDDVSKWAKDGVASLVSAGYIAGSNGKLNPKQSITRAEFAQVMDNLVKTYVNKEGTYTAVNEGNVMVNVPNVTLKDLTINGDLIIGDGVGDGDVTLENVTVTGRTVIRGGGENSIKITGSSKIKNIIIARVNGVVRVYAEDGTDVGEVIVDGSDDVIVEGSVGTVTVVAADVVVSASNATIKNINISAPNSGIIVSKDSKVDTIILDAEKSNVEVLGEVKSINTTKQAEKSSINVGKGGKVEEVEANGKGTTIDGKGSVESVEAKADNVEVNTPDTKVTAAKGTTGVIAGGKDVQAGKSTDTTEKKKGGNSGGSGGGRSDNDDDEDEPEQVLATIISMEQFLPGVYDVHVTLSVENPEDYTVSYDGREFKLEDGIFKGPSHTNAITSEDLVITEREKGIEIKATIVSMEQFLPGVYDVHVTLNVENPEDYTVSYDGREFKLEDGIFKGPSHTNAITAEDFSIVKK